MDGPAPPMVGRRVNLKLPRPIADRLRFVAGQRSRETGRKLSAQALGRAVVAEYVNKRLKERTPPR